MAAKSEVTPEKARVFQNDSWPKKLLLVPGLLLPSIGLVRNYFGNSSVSASPANEPICADAISYHFSITNRLVRANVHKDCLSGLIFSPDISIGKIGIDAPGSVRICLWNNDRCVSWVNTENNNSQEKQKKEIPQYSAIRLIGDEGVATFYLKK